MVSPVPPVRITAISNQLITLGAQTIGTLPMLYRWRRTAPSGAETILASTLETSRIHFATFSLSSLSNGTYVYALILSNAVQTFFLVTNAFVTVAADADRDGLPDDYEREHQFDLDDPRDAAMDPDEDGLTNFEEFLAGTDPRNPASFLKIDTISAGQSTSVRFGAISNKTYTLEYNDGLGSAWNKLADILAQPIDRIETVLDPMGGTNRYYRLSTPRQP